MELNLKTQKQRNIADMLWACQTLEEADRVVQVFGREAEVIRELMLLEFMDQESTKVDASVRKLLTDIANKK